MSRLLVLFFLLLFAGCNEEEKKHKELVIHYGEQNRSEPFYYQQWALEVNETIAAQQGIDPDAHINFTEVATLYSGKGVKVAVIDDGLDVDHEDLNGSVVYTKDLENNISNVPHDYLIENHGTAVTGIIAARRNQKGILGVAPESEIIFLKMNHYSDDSLTIDIFEEANRSGADIINCSWGTYSVSSAVAETIERLATKGRDGKGIIFVFSAGNDDRNIRYDESALPAVIGVGSTDINNTRAEYSNYGEELDIVAPGGHRLGITTLDPTGYPGQSSSSEPDYLLYDDNYSFAGTSASAPLVSGAVALLLEANPELTRIQIQEILRNSADKIGDSSYTDGKNIYYGYGKLNLKRALEMALSR